MSSKAALHRFPTDPVECADIESAIEKYILPGWLPSERFMTRGSLTASAGSCFAQHIAEALTASGVTAAFLQYKEGTNTPAATDMLIKRCLSPDSGADQVRKILKSADLLVITHGVALTPVVDGQPITDFPSKATIHKLDYRMLSSAEVEGYTLSTIDALRAVNPGLNIVLTISPLPLSASLLHASVFSEDCLSKSSLKVGVDAVIWRKIPGVFYWPSFEMVRWLSPHVAPFFGTEGADNRHIPKSLIATITQLFIRHYFADASELLAPKN